MKIIANHEDVLLVGWKGEGKDMIKTKGVESKREGCLMSPPVNGNCVCLPV